MQNQPDIRRIPLACIYGNPNQPRKTFDPSALRELADSILANGLIQPITVREEEDGLFMIVAGERRFMAHQLAGIPDIAAQVVDIDDDRLAEQAIIENLQRADISPIEEAKAFQARLDTGISTEELARRLGLKQAFRITERTDLLKLKPEYQDMLARNQLTPTQAYEMTKLTARGQDTLFRAIRLGQCPSAAAIRAVAASIREQERQVSIFELGEGQQISTKALPSDDQRRLARGLEAKIEKVGDLIAAGFDENEVVAARKVDPNRAVHLADRLALMAKHIKQMELALRQAAVQMDLVA